MPRSKPPGEPKFLHPMKAFATVSAHTEGIRINRLEDRKVPLVPFPHKHDFYHLLLITQGKGWHEIDFERHEIVRGSLFLMRPAQIHSWSLSAKAKGWIVEFEAKTLLSKDIRWNQLTSILMQLPEHKILDRKRFAEIAALIEGAYGENESKQLGFELIMLSTVAQLLIKLLRLSQQSSKLPVPSDDLYHRFLELVELHYKEEHSVEFYASALKLSAKALTMRFYRDQLNAPRTVIQDRCLLEAKRLLAYSNLSISEIADSLGFEDPNYFSRFFRKKTAQSPGFFRNET